MTLRLRGSKTELEEMGEDVTDMATTTSQLQAKLLALTGGQVDIMADANTFKNSTQILREMAEAWEDMTDIQRASALELMGGKRQANTLSALIQNFDTVENVIETSANSAGSALKENERYLDSIQGRIDQFNNSLQAMWSDTLDSDMVKGIVAFGTEIIKVIDNIGLLGSALIAIGAYKGFGVIFDTLKASGITIDSITKKLGSYLFGLQATATAESKLTQVQLQKKLVNQGMLDDEAKDIVLKTGLGVATDKLTRETLEAVLAEKGYSAEKKQAILDEIFGVTVTEMSTGALIKKNIQQKLANSTLVQYAISMKLATAEEVANMTITQLLGLGFKGLTTAIWGATKAIAAFLLTNPVGWLILAIGAIAGGIAIFNHFHKTIEELTEELNELKNELRDIQSELESVNSELETTQDRMAELLAKDKLSFVEEEELDNLKKQNDELQREIDLLELKEKQMKKDTADKFVETMESDINTSSGFGAEYKLDGDKIRKTKWYDWIFDFSNTYSPITDFEVSEDDYIQQQVSRYQELQSEIAAKEKEILKTDGTDKKSQKKRKKLEKQKKKLEDESDEVERYINGKTTEWGELSEGLDYGISDETDAWLDYINNMQDKWAIASGGKNAKTNAITRIFNKDEYSDISDSIDGYVEALKNGDESAKDKIDSIIRNNKDLVADLQESGVKINDEINEVANYFTDFASEANYATIEGKIKEMAEATSRLSTALSGDFETTNLDQVKQALTDKGWVDTEGNLMSDAISEYFGGEDGGISSETQAEIERLVQQIYDGKISVDTALKQFELFGIESTIDIQIKEVQTNFKDVFVDLEDADGLINTFEELGEAIGSTVSALDALNKAQGEMNYSGRVSIQTALELMQYTDNYADVLEVVDGKLQLNKNAEENLINARITAMKVSAQTALADAQAAYEKAKLATQTYNDALTTDMSASVVAKSWEKVLAAGAGLIEGIKSLLTEESWTEAYNRAYNETLSKMTGYETTYDDAGLQALVDAQAEAEQAVKNAQGNVDLLSGINADNIGGMYKSDDIEDPEDAAKTKLEELMEEYQREMDYWENRIGANQARYEQLQNEIDLLEAKGQKADASYYDEQIKLENERKWLLEKQREAASSYLAMLEEGSEEWWEVANTLNDIEGELDDVTASIVDLQDAIGEIDTYKFEEFNNRLDNLTSKLETIRNLIAPNGEEDWFDDEGNWTEAGVAYLGSYIQDLADFNEGLTRAKEEYAKYTEEYAGNEDYYANLGIHSEQELYDKREELIEQQYDYAESINDTEQSVVDMYESNIDAIEEYTETLIDSYNDYIDSVKEALDAERDLYDFKKNVQKQSKDIAAIERRIASLSGSTNASDVAERRKLEAELYESRESLNDTYYDHARSSQDEALDAEQTAYEKSMNQFVEGLRISLETATMNMDEFLMGVTSMVMYNADTVLTKYQETNLPLTDELTNPWIKAKEAVGTYSGDALALMNKWTEEGGFFAQFNATGTKNLQSPWSAGSTAAGAFKTSVSTTMEQVVANIESNIKKAKASLASLTDVITTTATYADGSVGESYSGNNGSGNTGSGTGGGLINTLTQVIPKKITELFRPASPTRPKFKKVGDLWSGVGHTGVSIGKKTYNKASEIEGGDGIYYPYTNGNGYKGYIKKGEGYTVLSNGKMDIQSFKPIYQKYAKGTIGTDRDQWAITDEPQFGDELVLVPGKDGNLSFMRKGTGVVPADMTQKLFELAQIPTSDLMNKNLTAIVPNITKNDFKNEFNFESLVHVDTVDSDTLPKLEKMVDKKIDDFSKALNYSLKRFAR